jgi:hypothetical protein
MNKDIKIAVLKAVSNGLISKVEAKYLLDLNGKFTPNFSRKDKAYNLTSSVFEKNPWILSLFEIDLSELTDEELRNLIELQEQNKN